MSESTGTNDALARLKAAIDAKPPELQAEQDRRYAALLRMTTSGLLRPRPQGDRAAPLLEALRGVDAEAEAKGIDPYNRRDAVAEAIATHVALAFGKPVTQAGKDGVWRCIRDYGDAVVRHVAIELVRENASNAREPMGLLVHRARLRRKALEESRARKGPRR